MVDIRGLWYGLYRSLVRALGKCVATTFYWQLFFMDLDTVIDWCEPGKEKAMSEETSRNLQESLSVISGSWGNSDNVRGHRRLESKISGRQDMVVVVLASFCCAWIFGCPRSDSSSLFEATGEHLDLHSGWFKMAPPKCSFAIFKTSLYSRQNETWDQEHMIHDQFVHHFSPLAFNLFEQKPEARGHGQCNPADLCQVQHCLEYGGASWEHWDKWFDVLRHWCV